MTGEEHSDRNTVNEKSDHNVGDDHHARCAHPVVEAGSIVLHVNNDMNVEKKNGEEADETAAAKETEKKSEDLLRRGTAHPKKKNND